MCFRTGTPAMGLAGVSGADCPGTWTPTPVGEDGHRARLSLPTNVAVTTVVQQPEVGCGGVGNVDASAGAALCEMVGWLGQQRLVAGEGGRGVGGRVVGQLAEQAGRKYLVDEVLLFVAVGRGGGDRGP